MKRPEHVLVTYNYDHASPEGIIGRFHPMPEGMSKSADAIWDLFAACPERFTFEPAYAKHEDGTVELVEISLVLKQKAPQSNGASMALDDLIADLD